MTVDDIYNFVSYELNKNQVGNTLNQAEFNLCLAWGNAEFFKRRYGIAEQYRVGMPLPNMAYEQSQLIMDEMSKFKNNYGGRDYPLLRVDINGQGVLPPDFIHLSSITYNGNRVEILRDAQYQDRLKDSIKFPSKTDPVCTMYGNYIQFQPTDLAFVDMVYLRMPQTPYWAVTIVNDAYIYNPAASVQLEWSETNHTDIASLILGYASMNLRDNFGKQAADTRKQGGI